MNSLCDATQIGTLGELLVQLRLLEHGVQAAPPLKDSGNDLVAIRGSVFKAIQVKTTTSNRFSKNHLPEGFHILAVVGLVIEGGQVLLDQSKIFFVPQERVHSIRPRVDSLGEFELRPEFVDLLFHAM